jgi:hypothetical protein
MNGSGVGKRTMGTTYLQSTSLPVFSSMMTSRTHGGGVMGRRSWQDVSARGALNLGVQLYIGADYFITEATHAGAFGLLHYLESILVSCQQPSETRHPPTTEVAFQGEREARQLGRAQLE